MASERTHYSGVTREQEVHVKSRRVDTRGFWDRVVDNAETVPGTILNFGTLMALTLFGSWIPFVPEVCLFLTVLMYFRFYRYKKRYWSAPFRVPAYLKAKTGQDYLDETTGKPGNGDIYLGHDLETKREVWASLDDIRTHRLTVGTTGSGKTEEFLGECFNALVHDSGFFFLDGKGDKAGSLAGALKLARLFWRDDDVYQLNYVMGGEDAQGFSREKRSNTFNPLQNMGSSAMSEIMVSLLSDAGGEGKMWQDRAVSLLEGLIPPLNHLAREGYLLLNPGTLSRFLPLRCVEDLYCHQAFIDHEGQQVNLSKLNPQKAKFLKDNYLGALRIYLENLPGWEWPDTQPFEGRSDTKVEGPASKQKPGGAEQRAESTKQHGFLVMQVVKPLTDLAFNYGHIYNVQIGEIDFKDIARNRRILVGLLPALERSKVNMASLGKMSVASVKNVLATGLAGPVAGKWTEVMTSQEVARGPVPFFLLCDEYGYYVVDGFAVAPAQARSLGFAITFGLQDVDGLKDANPAEGEATLQNTNLSMFGKMTAGAESETFRVASAQAGEAYVQEVDELIHKTVGPGMTDLSVEKSRMTRRSRLDYDDMAAQGPGYFHLVVGTPVRTRRGIEQQVRIVRMLSFYTGLIRPPDAVRPLELAYITPLSAVQRGEVRASLILDDLLKDEDKLMELGQMAAQRLETVLEDSVFQVEETKTIKLDIMEYVEYILGSHDETFAILMDNDSENLTISEEGQMRLKFMVDNYFSILDNTRRKLLVEGAKEVLKAEIESKETSEGYKRSLVELIDGWRVSYRPSRQTKRRNREYDGIANMVAERVAKHVQKTNIVKRSEFEKEGILEN